MKKWTLGLRRKRKRNHEQELRVSGVTTGVYSACTIFDKLTRNSAERADCTWLCCCCAETKRRLKCYFITLRLRYDYKHRSLFFLTAQHPSPFRTHKPQPFKENADWLWRYCQRLGSSPFSPFYLDKKVN